MAVPSDTVARVSAAKVILEVEVMLKSACFRERWRASAKSAFAPLSRKNMTLS